MVLKAHLLFRFTLILSIINLLVSCSGKIEEEPVSSSFIQDTIAIPTDTTLTSSKALKLENGIYYYNNQPWSGYIKGLYPTGAVQYIGGVYKGKQHGVAVSYYPGGELQDKRQYRANKSYGLQQGYWQNGHQRFEFMYVDDRREGMQKQWYESGQRYAFLHFKNDREDGMQHAWRENGKAYINYEVKDGIRYGLQKSALCYTLEKEKFK
jgi:antitoxin component YwqK of YwqJK toxin-antitoxin module